MSGDNSGAGFTARVTFPFKGCRDGEIHPRQWAVGDEIHGDLARAMVPAGYAKALRGSPENKALAGPSQKKTGGLTGAAKPLSSQQVARAKGAKTSKRRAAKPAS